MDVTLVEEEREALRAKLVAAEERLLGLQEKADAQKNEHASKLDTCGGDRASLEKEVLNTVRRVCNLHPAVHAQSPVCIRVRREGGNRPHEVPRVRTTLSSPGEITKLLLWFPFWVFHHRSEAPPEIDVGDASEASLWRSARVITPPPPVSLTHSSRDACGTVRT